MTSSTPLPNATATSPRPMTRSYSGRRAPLRQRVQRSLITPGGAIFVLLVLLFIALIFYNPSLGEPGQFMRFIGRTSPILIVAIGQFFVIVSGELDLSMGAVISAQVVLAGNLIGSNAGRVLPVLGLMLVVGAVIGLINGAIITVLRVPSFIATLGTALVISGITFYVTGGAPSGNPANEFRAIGRSGLEGIPVLGFLPFSVIVLVVLAAGAVWLMRRPFGRLLLAVGDNARTAALAGASVSWIRLRAFVLSALASTVAAVLLVGYAGVSPVVGQGYEFAAITAVVLGGVALGGGRGWVLSALAGALVLEVLFSLLDFVGIASTWRPAVQGGIILLAVALPLIPWGRLRLRRVGVPPSPGPEADTTAVQATKQ